MGMHTAGEGQALRHRDEFAVHQDLGLGDHAGAADLARTVGIDEKGVERLHALHQALVQVLPLVPGDDARNDVEGDRCLMPVDRAVGAEGDAVASVELVDLVARRRHPLGRRAGEPVRDTAVGRTDRFPGSGPRVHFVKCLGGHPAFNPLSNHLISNR